MGRAQGLAVEGGDALAELLLQVGVEQHALVQDEAGGAVEVVDPGLLAVALGGDVAVQVEQAGERRLLPLGFEEAFHRHVVDVLLRAEQRHVLAHVEAGLGVEAAVVEVAAHVLQLQLAAAALQLEAGVGDRQLVEGQLADVQGDVQVQRAQAGDGQDRRVAPGLLGRRVGQRGVALGGAGDGGVDFGLAVDAGGFLGLHCLRWQVAVEVQAVAVELHAQGLPGDVGDRQVAAEGAVVELQLEVAQLDAVARAAQAGGQLDLAEGAVVGHGRQRLAEAFEEFAQVELGDGQAAVELRLLVQFARLQLADGAQLVDRQLQAVPFGDLRGLVDQQLALGGESRGLALQLVAGGLAGELGVLQLVALERAVEAQVAGQLGARAHHRLIGAEVGAELERNAAALADAPGGEVDAFDAVALAALLVGVVDARVLHAQAVDVQGQRLAGFAGGRRGRLAAAGLRRWRRCRGAVGRLRRLADVFPVAGAVPVAGQGEGQAVDADVAHLHLPAQQRQHAHREAEQLGVGERLVRRLQGGDAGVVQFQAEPGEQAPADVAAQVQFDVGLVAGELADFVLVVVRVEEVGEDEAPCDDCQKQDEQHDAQDFAERFHGRILVQTANEIAGKYINVMAVNRPRRHARRSPGWRSAPVTRCRTG
ncbi:hypothetical protein D9M71_145230 [compost metagenome]